MINDDSIKYIPFHKHIGPLVDLKPKFNEYLDSILTKVNNIKALH